MSEREPKQGLPVGGYRPQSAEAIAAVNSVKVYEETVLRILDAVAADPELKADPRWFAIGRTQIEQGFMAINRSIFKPSRLSNADFEKITATPDVPV